MDMYPFIHPVLFPLRIVGGASSDNSYDFYDVSPDPVVSSALGHSISWPDYWKNTPTSAFHRLGDISSNSKPPLL